MNSTMGFGETSTNFQKIEERSPPTRNTALHDNLSQGGITTVGLGLPS